MDKTVSLGSANGTITPPSSKSYAQRAIALALLAEGRTTLRNIEFCKDTRSAISCIEALGAKVSYLDDSTIAVDGGLNPVTDMLMVGESGLATRLFTPIASLNSTPICIKGEGTLLHRPMIMMIEPLRKLGVEVRDGGGHLPSSSGAPSTAATSRSTAASRRSSSRDCCSRCPWPRRTRRSTYARPYRRPTST